MAPGVTRVAIIGAGYAGLAAAVELTGKGIAVTVFERSRILGGRARVADIQGMSLDNGQHILIGAYRETLRLMRQVGADSQRLLLRQPLTLEYPGHLRIAAPRWPAPLHLAAALLGAQGISWSDKLAAIRFMQSLKKQHFQLPTEMNDCSVGTLLDAHRQPARLRSYLWEPLCVAALNTPPDIASAQVFLNVLRDSLAAERSCSDLLLPCIDLSSLFPLPAARYVTAHGGQIVCESAIRGIDYHSSEGYTLRLDNGDSGDFSHVIIAVAPYHVAPLVEKFAQLAAIRQQIDELHHEPITTCYLAYPPRIRLSEAMLGHAEGIAQWLFDRGQLGGPSGLLAAVISARGRHLELSNQELSERIHAEIATVLPDLPSPLWSQIVTEKRATFSCTAGLVRPSTRTPLTGLLLAGDYVASDYPGTLESAVRSGIQAAKSILSQTATH